MSCCALQNLQQSGCQRIYLDGSFATSKELPGDFDVAWETDQQAVPKGIIAIDLRTLP